MIEFLPKSPSEENTQCLFLAHLTERLIGEARSSGVVGLQYWSDFSEACTLITSPKRCSRLMLNVFFYGPFIAFTLQTLTYLQLTRT